MDDELIEQIVALLRQQQAALAAAEAEAARWRAEARSQQSLADDAQERSQRLARALANCRQNVQTCMERNAGLRERNQGLVADLRACRESGGVTPQPTVVQNASQRRMRVDLGDKTYILAPGESVTVNDSGGSVVVRERA